MKLDYKILWLDDKIDDFRDDEYIEELKAYLREEEFNPIIHDTDNPNNFYDYLKRDTYDLILTDFNLNETIDNKGINGNDIVESVRKKNVFTEILFYTAKATLQSKITWDRISFLETENLLDNHHEAVMKKIKKLIDLTIEKFHDIVVMRGMIMNETSFLDEHKNSLLECFIASDKYKEKIPQVRERLFKEVQSFLNEKSRKIDKCIKKQDLQDLIDDTVLFSADKKNSAMSEILQILGQEDFSGDYKKEIISIRNDFAHLTLVEETDKEGKILRKYFRHKKSEIIFDDTYCKTIRASIKKHKRNLEILEENLGE